VTSADMLVLNIILTFSYDLLATEWVRTSLWTIENAFSRYPLFRIETWHWCRLLPYHKIAFEKMLCDRRRISQ